jgi:GGDEF domain-containing protein
LSHEKKSEQLIQAATHDPLTGLLNRRGMQLAIERWQQAQRNMQKCARRSFQI